MIEMIWMLIAPLMGLKVETSPIARFRLRLKKLTATVLGTTPTRAGLAMALPTAYAT